jgi:hypothetical protein
MEKKTITLNEVHVYVSKHFPDYITSDYSEGEDSFYEYNRFLSFSGFANYLIHEGFKKNNEALIQHVADYINLLLAEGDELVRNPVYVSFIEGLVDRGYKYPQLKGFIGQMPQNVKTFIKDFFIEEVLIALDLKDTSNPIPQ